MQVADKITTGAAFVYQVVTGATSTAVVGTVATQAITGGQGLDPALMAAYGAIGALFSLYVWSTKGRTERCEKREDKMLDADVEKTTTLKEVSTTLVKVVDVAASSMEGVKRVESKLDSAMSTIAGLERHIRDLEATRNRGTG